NVSGALENMKTFIEELSAAQDQFGNRAVTGFKEAIRLQNINFSYFQSTPVLNDISLTINKNETVAFVGESGSGKTTLVNLISGLLTPREGEIFLDGIPFSEMDLATLQEKIGYITQE